jgi:phage gp29-like protein
LPLSLTMKIDALQKYQNQLLSAFNAEQLQYLKYDNWSGLLTETDRLYATMFHDWDVLQKDSSDLAEAVQTLEWTVAPYVADGEEADPKAQAVAKVVTDALWKRTPRKPGTYSHTFSQLLNALVHCLYRGYNVHEIEWVNDGQLVYPAAFHQLPPQFMRWEDRAGEVDRLLFVPDGESAEARPFPANRYIVALNTNGPDHPLYNALYYSLIAWYGAYKFGLGWFMEYCQKYGMPKLVFHYESEKDRKQLEQDLAEERVLNNILLKGDRSVDIANAPASGASLPQRELLTLAESQCHKLILGQTLTSDTSENGGSLAQARVHAGVQAEIVKKRADFVADVLNTQLIPAIVLLNFGSLDVPMPELRYKIPQEGVTLERVQVVKTALEIKGMKLKKSEVYEFTGFAQPAEGDDVFEAASEGGEMAGLAGLLEKGKGKPQDTTDPDNEPPKPKKKVKPSTEDDAEPVSAARTDAPTDPAQEWLAPIKKKFLEARKSGASMADLKKMLLTMHPNTQALAKAFANNILAGFAGESEEVDAASSDDYSRRRKEPIEMPDGTKCYTEGCERHEDRGEGVTAKDEIQLITGKYLKPASYFNEEEKEAWSRIVKNPAAKELLELVANDSQETAQSDKPVVYRKTTQEECDDIRKQAAEQNNPLPKKFNLEEYDHTINESHITHSLKRHGHGKNGGQLKREDFALVPEIIDNPDKRTYRHKVYEDGRIERSVRYLKNFGNRSYTYVEHLLSPPTSKKSSKKRELAMVTAWLDVQKKG